MGFSSSLYKLSTASNASASASSTLRAYAGHAHSGSPALPPGELPFPVAFAILAEACFPAALPRRRPRRDPEGGAEPTGGAAGRLPAWPVAHVGAAAASEQLSDLIPCR